MDNTTIHLPDKLAFKQKEVIKITRLEGKVIDYWQKEFGGFEPTVNSEGEKFYTKTDIQLILKIRQWIIVEKIEKARIKEMINGREIKGEEERNVTNPVSNNADSPGEMKTIRADQLKIIKQNLKDILTILNKHDK